MHERFQVRTESGVRTHLFCALQAFSRLQTMGVEGLIDNLYQVSRQLLVICACHSPVHYQQSSSSCCSLTP